MSYADFETKEAFLSNPFGEAKARAWFGDAAVDALPCYVRGPNAGRPKGVYRWTRVTRGGWVRCPELEEGGYVETRRGAIIERELCALESGRYGRGAGDVLGAQPLGLGRVVEVPAGGVVDSRDREFELPVLDADGRLLQRRRVGLVVVALRVVLGALG